MRAAGFATAIVWLGCSSGRAARPERQAVIQADACARTCGWPTELPPCAQRRSVIEYTSKLLPPIWNVAQALGGLRGECVCFRVRLTAIGELAEVKIDKATSAQAAERVTQAVHGASPAP